MSATSEENISVDEEVADEGSESAQSERREPAVNNNNHHHHHAKDKNKDKMKVQTEVRSDPPIQPANQPLPMPNPPPPQKKNRADSPSFPKWWTDEMNKKYHRQAPEGKMFPEVTVGSGVFKVVCDLQDMQPETRRKYLELAKDGKIKLHHLAVFDIRRRFSRKKPDSFLDTICECYRQARDRMVNGLPPAPPTNIDISVALTPKPPAPPPPPAAAQTPAVKAGGKGGAAPKGKGKAAAPVCPEAELVEAANALRVSNQQLREAAVLNQETADTLMQIKYVSADWFLALRKLMSVRGASPDLRDDPALKALIDKAKRELVPTSALSRTIQDLERRLLKRENPASSPPSPNDNHQPPPVKRLRLIVNGASAPAAAAAAAEAEEMMEEEDEEQGNEDAETEEEEEEDEVQ